MTNKKAFSSEFYNEKEVVKFYTQGFFIDNKEVYELYNNSYRKSLRKVAHLENEIDQLIESSTHFLQNILLNNGKYIYGYLPHFDNEIGFYNILRHSTSTYALIEELAYLKVAKGIDEDTYMNYPDLSVKEKFRIIYYDGETSLALLRLYQRDKNELMR